ncbi:MAG TPA: SurA N-terminal domain-containing protein [Aliidongia sp.]|uniref:peptidylprolyl isomerase n=1 Tax=Aliidongia sp. TaxID=1914230 RepID=UPI002DDD2F6D|nr:SurA N-terminal domain-containing protein [Aliidongia sp.]HEV2678521.1 SurA N-terminal domain-containing protein [Aliidongia sp.]
MLQFIRSKAGTFIVKVLFVLLILSFGIWGIGDFLRSTPQDATVATVGGHKITGDVVQQSVRQQVERMRQQFGGNFDMQQAKAFGIIDQAVDGLVSQTVLDQEAQRLNLVVGDKEVALLIQNEPAFKNAQGQFDRGSFIMRLGQAGYTEKRYVDLLRGEQPRVDLATVAGGTVTAPKALADLLYRLRGEKRVADWVFLPTNAIKDVPAPDDAALKAYYDKHPDAFTAPEYRGFTTLALTTKDVAADVKIDDAQLKEAYAQRQDEFVKPEKRHLLQMILPDQKAADDAEAQLAQGKDFVKLAQDLTKADPAAVDLGSVTAKDLPAELATPVFAAQDGAVVKPIQTAFGWHVLKVTGIEAAGGRSFDEVKPQLEADARKDAESDALYTLSTKVEDAVSAGADLATIAQQFKLTPLTVTAADAGGLDPDGKPIADFAIAADALMKTVFATPQGQTSGLEQVPNGSYYLVRTESITAPALKPLDAVKDQVRTAWTDEQRAAKVAEQAKALADQVKPDQPLTKLAAAQKLQVSTTKPFIRTVAGNQAGVPPAVVAKLFDLQPGGVASAAAPDGQFVAQLKEIQPADLTADKDKVATLGGQLAQQVGDDMLSEFDQALRKVHPVQIYRDRIANLF